MVKIGKLNICLTNCCNHRCFYCRYQYKDQITMTKDNIDTILHKTVREYPRLTPAEFSITGGEPFLYPELVLHFINQLNSITMRNKININTNFTLDNIDNMIELYKFKSFNIHVSLPSFDKEVFMKTVAVKDDRTHINLIHNLENWMSVVGKDLTINIVVTELNKNTVIDTVKELKKMGITTFFLSPIITSPKSVFTDIFDGTIKNVIDFKVANNEYGEIVKEVNELTGQYNILNNITCTPFCHYPEHIKSNLREMSCLTPNTFHNLPINPDGNMTVCNATIKKGYIGNIYEEDFQTIIDNRKKWLEESKPPYEKCYSCSDYKKRCNGACF